MMPRRCVSEDGRAGGLESDNDPLLVGQQLAASLLLHGCTIHDLQHDENKSEQLRNVSTKNDALAVGMSLGIDSPSRPQ